MKDGRKKANNLPSVPHFSFPVASLTEAEKNSSILSRVVTRASFVLVGFLGKFHPTLSFHVPSPIKRGGNRLSGCLACH